jgi:[protein-PII] uridylyltransferase
MGVAADRREHVLFLVREHLLLSDTATRRNLDDEDLVLHVAAHVRDPERLAMLYLLTVADARATGPIASSPWRMTLVRELVAKVSRTFDRGQMDAGRAARLQTAEHEVRDALLAAGRGEVEADGFLASMPPGYMQWVQPHDAAAHVGLVSPPPAPDEVRTHIAPGRSPGTHLVAVGARDRVGLLAATAGAFALSGLTILAAQAFTTSEGVALDVFDVGRAFEDEVDEARWERFRTNLREALAGGGTEALGAVDERLRALRAHYPRPETGIPVEVRMDHETSDYFTVVEVRAPDRVGLLFDLTRTFAGLRLDVHLAKVATYGPRVVDAFYVTDEAGGKLTDRERTDLVVRSLAAAARGD